MELLFVTPQLPWPPKQGAAIRNYHLMRGLSVKHSVSLLTFAPAGVGSVEGFDLARLEILPPPVRHPIDRLHTLALTSKPDMARRLYSPAMLERLRSMLRERHYDWVHIEGIEMAPYAREVWSFGPGRPRWLFDEHNAEYALQRGAFFSDLRELPRPRPAIGAAYSLEQWARLRIYERAAVRTADAVIAVSPLDRAELLKLDSSLDIAVVPNGVDIAYWSPDTVSDEAAALAVRYDGPLLVFDGSMDFRPNVDAAIWFCRDIFPLVHAARPDATFAIVGRNPTPAVQKLGEMPGVVVTGAVDDTRPWVAAASVYVVPMRMGGGVRLKVLQAMAMGRPLVSTAIGMQGITAAPGSDYLVAEDPGAFAAAVLLLLDDPAQQAALGKGARSAAAKYSWDAIVPMLEEVIARKT